MRIADTPRQKKLALLVAFVCGVVVTLAGMSLALLHRPDPADATAPSEETGSAPPVTSPSVTSTTDGSYDPAPDALERFAFNAPDKLSIAPVHPEGVTIVGDSLAVATEHLLREAIPGVAIDGRVGRQFSEGVRIVAAMREAGELTDTVVVELGTNGYVSQSDMDAMLLLLGDVSNVYLVNVRVPRDWESSVNARLAEAADDHEPVAIIDWNTVAEERPELLAGDGYHLSSGGEVAFTQLIAFFATAA